MHSALFLGLDRSNRNVCLGEKIAVLRFAEAIAVIEPEPRYISLRLGELGVDRAWMRAPAAALEFP